NLRLSIVFRQVKGRSEVGLVQRHNNSVRTKLGKPARQEICLQYRCFEAEDFPDELNNLYYILIKTVLVFSSLLVAWFVVVGKAEPYKFVNGYIKLTSLIEKSVTLAPE
ncbi:hypothetical protein Avbf_17064, partial [Armadillidium vulgare]